MGGELQLDWTWFVAGFIWLSMLALVLGCMAGLVASLAKLPILRWWGYVPQWGVVLAGVGELLLTVIGVAIFMQAGLLALMIFPSLGVWPSLLALRRPEKLLSGGPWTGKELAHAFVLSLLFPIIGVAIFLLLLLVMHLLR